MRTACRCRKTLPKTKVERLRSVFGAPLRNTRSHNRAANRAGCDEAREAPWLAARFRRPCVCRRSCLHLRAGGHGRRLRRRRYVPPPPGDRQPGQRLGRRALDDRAVGARSASRGTDTRSPRASDLTMQPRCVQMREIGVDTLVVAERWRPSVPAGRRPRPAASDLGQRHLELASRATAAPRPAAGAACRAAPKSSAAAGRRTAPQAEEVAPRHRFGFEPRARGAGRGRGHARLHFVCERDAFHGDGVHRAAHRAQGAADAAVFVFQDGGVLRRESASAAECVVDGRRPASLVGVEVVERARASGTASDTRRRSRRRARSACRRTPASRRSRDSATLRAAPARRCSRSRPRRRDAAGAPPARATGTATRRIAS